MKNPKLLSFFLLFYIVVGTGVPSLCAMDSLIVEWSGIIHVSGNVGSGSRRLQSIAEATSFLREINDGRHHYGHYLGFRNSFIGVIYHLCWKSLTTSRIDEVEKFMHFILTNDFKQHTEAYLVPRLRGFGLRADLKDDKEVQEVGLCLKITEESCKFFIEKDLNSQTHFYKDFVCPLLKDASSLKLDNMRDILHNFESNLKDNSKRKLDVCAKKVAALEAIDCEFASQELLEATVLIESFPAGSTIRISLKSYWDGVFASEKQKRKTSCVPVNLELLKSVTNRLLGE